MNEGREPLFTLEETCVKARSGYATIRRAVKNGDLDSVRAGRRVLIPASALQEYLSRGTTATTKAPVPTTPPLITR